jgi:hypothetical protein
VVTGTHYRTKAPPDQQPACYAQGYSKTGGYLQYVSSMASRVRCLVEYVVRYALSSSVYQRLVVFEYSKLVETALPVLI